MAVSCAAVAFETGLRIGTSLHRRQIFPRGDFRAAFDLRSREGFGANSIPLLRYQERMRHDYRKGRRPRNLGMLEVTAARGLMSGAVVGRC